MLPSLLSRSRFVSSSLRPRFFSVSWNDGTFPVAKVLFEKYTWEPYTQDERPFDPFGMRVSELKKKLRELKTENAFNDEPSRAEEFHGEVVREWKIMYDEMINSDVPLPGKEKAGPFTFAKVSDKLGNKDEYDKYGRVSFFEGKAKKLPPTFIQGPKEPKAGEGEEEGK